MDLLLGKQVMICCLISHIWTGFEMKGSSHVYLPIFSFPFPFTFLSTLSNLIKVLMTLILGNAATQLLSAIFTGLS